MPDAKSTTGHITPELLSRIKQAIQNASASGNPTPLIIEKSISSLSLPAWFKSATAWPKVFWHSRDGHTELAGAGTALSIEPETVTAFLGSVPESEIQFIFVGGFGNGQPNDDVWQGFAKQMCYLPETLVVRQNDSFVMRHCLVVLPENTYDEVLERVERLSFDCKINDEISKEAIQARLTAHHPDRGLWNRNIKSIQDSIASGNVSKVVSARRSDYSLDCPVSPGAAFSHLSVVSSDTYQFIFQPTDDAAFISLTPERLFYRNHKTILLDAIASTEPRGKTDAEDAQLAQLLHSDAKQQEEHKYVVDYVVNTISPYCISPATIEPVEVLKLSVIQHLRTPISGTLKEVNDIEIIKALHPTPAVGGTPKDKALELIDSLEPFERGWYASPIGILSKDVTEIAVGIRSLVLRGKNISVFTGAGIVAASDADREWDEIESKNILGRIDSARD